MRSVLFLILAVILCLVFFAVVGSSSSLSLSSLPPAPATIDIEADLFNKIIKDVVPVVDKFVKDLVIPGLHGKDFSTADIKISTFNLGAISVVFEKPDKLRVNIKDMALAIPDTHFDIWVKVIFKASCGGYFSVSMSGTSATFTLPLTNIDGKLHCGEASDVDVTWGRLTVYHRFHSGVCRFLEHVLEIFVGSIDKLIKDVVQKEIVPILYKALPPVFNKIFGKLKLQFDGEPEMKQDSMSLSIDLDSLFHNVSSSSSSVVKKINNKININNKIIQLVKNARSKMMMQQQTKKQQNVNIPSYLSPRDLTVSLPQSSIDTVLYELTALKKLDGNKTLNITTDIFKLLLPKAYTACEDCKLNLKFAPLLAPFAVFLPDNNASLDLRNFSVAISGVKKINGNEQNVPLFDLGLDLIASLGNFSMSGDQDNIFKFDIAIPSAKLVDISSHVGPLDLKLINSVIDIVIGTFVGIWNKDEKGIKFPSLDGIVLSNLEVVTTSGMFTFGTSVTLPPL